MSADLWLRAIEALEAQQPQRVCAISDSEEDEEVTRAADELRYFLESSDGQIALRLLSVCEDYIELATASDGGVYRWVWFLDEKGLQTSHEAVNGHAADVYCIRPRISPATAEEIVREMVRCRESSPQQVLTHLKHMLNLIADGQLRASARASA